MAFAAGTRVEVSGHRSELGRWRAAQRTAELRLRDYVLGFFASRSFLPKPLNERHLPPREVAIVLNFGAPHRIIDPSDPKRTAEHGNAWIVALQHRYHIREAFGSRDFMVIRLTPLGAHTLLQVPMDLLTDRVLALDDIDSRFSRLLMNCATATQDWPTRFDIIEKMIAARLASASSPPCGLLHSWQMLQNFPNDIDLSRMPAQLGCSRRHLIAQFHKYFGMAPKTIARISRFNLAVAAVHRLGRRGYQTYAEGKPYLDCPVGEHVRTGSSTKMKWVDLALDCGYYDQSHFINEFKSFSGLSPFEFLQQTRTE